MLVMPDRGFLSFDSYIVIQMSAHSKGTNALEISGKVRIEKVAVKADVLDLSQDFGTTSH